MPDKINIYQESEHKYKSTLDYCIFINARYV